MWSCKLHPSQQEKKQWTILTFSANVLVLCYWTCIITSNTRVFCQEDSYQEIHRIWPSLRMPNVIISKATAEEEVELSQNETMKKLFPSVPTSDSTLSLASSRKTVVFPSPVSVSLPMAPCIILQIFWRNSSSSVLGVRVPTNLIPSWPRPQERRLSNSQFYKMYSV